ncbi:MAG: ThiF family adenylyltransferase [Deltaproteobacteria bacterium]|nr:ThiF family adenylyltransferase [Deltaproteobacteria bacterium]
MPTARTRTAVPNASTAASRPAAPANPLGDHLHNIATSQTTRAGELRLDPTTGELVLVQADAPARDGVVIDQIARDGFFTAPRVVLEAAALEGLLPGLSLRVDAHATDGLSVVHVGTSASGAPRPGWQSVTCVIVPVLAAGFERARAIAESVALEGARGCVALAVLVGVSPDAGPGRGGGGRERPAVAAVLANEGRVFRCEVTLGPARSELFSRSRGLLETDALAARKVGVVGLGSGGAPIALDLARAGVGSFVLIDPDTLELANVVRHPCGLRDLGRTKVAAVRDAILDRNPYARVETHAVDINADLSRSRALLDGCDLILGATDGTRSRSNINRIALDLRKPVLFGRAITRAAGGDVLRVRPGLGPCLACVFDLGRFGGADDEISGQQQALRDTPAYVPPHAVDARIQPGLATDIAPISNMLARLALVELSRGTGSSIASLEHDLEADLYLWANRREESYEAWAPMGFRMNELSVLRWYGVRARRNPSCVECGDGLRAAALRGGQVGIIDGPPPVWG